MVQVILKLCTDELAPIYHHLFTKYICDHEKPSPWETDAIVPSPKNNPAALNDFRPVALTSIQWP